MDQGQNNKFETNVKRLWDFVISKPEHFAVFKLTGAECRFKNGKLHLERKKRPPHQHLSNWDKFGGVALSFEDFLKFFQGVDMSGNFYFHHEAERLLKAIWNQFHDENFLSNQNESVQSLKDESYTDIEYREEMRVYNETYKICSRCGSHQYIPWSEDETICTKCAIREGLVNPDQDWN